MKVWIGLPRRQSSFLSNEYDMAGCHSQKQSRMVLAVPVSKHTTQTKTYSCSPWTGENKELSFVLSTVFFIRGCCDACILVISSSNLKPFLAEIVG